MKFSFYTDCENSYFKAIPDNDDETYGLRAQSPYTKIKLINETLIINYVSKKELHPDIIAAICLIAFYPFIKYNVEMPFPVSKTFATGLLMDILPQHDIVDNVYRATNHIVIKNIDHSLDAYKGEKTVISYGGGMDSTSIALLFPDFDIIHSVNTNDNIECKQIMKTFIQNNLKNNPHIINCNCKELSRPGGFTTFTNIFIIPLILSSDLQISNIMCGEVLESSCLSNGIKYFPQFDTNRRNRWMRFFQHIGLNIFSPIAGCSELITSKIVVKDNLHTNVLYCENDNGKQCLQCTKCLRKNLEILYNGIDNIDVVNNFNKNKITEFLQKRPLYFSNVNIETIKSTNAPEYMKECISDIINTETKVFTKIYSKSFVYFPENIRQKIINKLLEYSEIMNEEEEKYLEKWNLTNS